MMIKQMIAHRVGNKLRGEGVGFSNREIDTAPIANALVGLIQKSFKNEDLYFFAAEYDLDSNPVYSFVKNIFTTPSDFKTQSKHIAKSLYESSIHPKVKIGELCIIYLTDVEYGDAKVDALAIFKSESHQEVLQFSWGENGYEAQKTTGISLSKIDKGAMIYNVSSEKGYVVSIVDKIGRNSDAKYWTKSFLKIKTYNSSHRQTTNLIDICNDFVKNNIAADSTLSRLEKAMIASRAKDVLLHSDTESMTLKDYAEAVFRNQTLETLFSEYVENSENSEEIDFDSISIDKRAVTKRKNSISTIKLDDNFELYVNGAEDRISKGYDPDAALNYYKLYFEEEK